MQKNRWLIFGVLCIIINGLLFFTVLPTKPQPIEKLKFPYKAEGLTDREAAAHLLSRFSYGATPGQVDEVVSMGLENWFDKQLKSDLQDDSLNQRLSKFQYLNFTNTEALKRFPRPLQLLKMAAADGVIPKDSIKYFNRAETKKRLKDYIVEKKILHQSDFVREFINQKIVRATYSNNQLQEVLTGFWFNHFNISLTKPQVVLLAPSYERDVIRPHTLGKFSDLLMATAKSPAMQIFLDNYTSTGDNDSLANPPNGVRFNRAIDKYQTEKDTAAIARIEKIKNAQKGRGLNENYAREVMELHTLGVDGGYTQSDVTQTARVLTGWGIYPLDESFAPNIKRMIDAIGESKLTERGFVRDGDFLFAMNKHDVKSKKVLGKTFPSNVGYSEGVDLLNMLAHHPSTAKFISKKLAAYFVADNPPQSLVDKMAKTFLEKDGDMKSVLITMVNAPEFWSKNAVRQKIKSPFEFVVSASRALGADVNAPYQLFNRMDKMGQKIYYYQAPTGFPDKAENWINTGSLLNRMNFGLDIASQQLRGVTVDLLKINNNHEPENASDALVTYASLLMPGRDMGPTIKRLMPLLTNPSLEQKVNSAALNNSDNSKKANPEKNTSMMIDDDLMIDDVIENQSPENKIKSDGMFKNMLAQVVGIIIGSPEFQRR